MTSPFLTEKAREKEFALIVRPSPTARIVIEPLVDESTLITISSAAETKSSAPDGTRITSSSVVAAAAAIASLSESTVSSDEVRSMTFAVSATALKATAPTARSWRSSSVSVMSLRGLKAAVARLRRAFRFVLLRFLLLKNSKKDVMFLAPLNINWRETWSMQRTAHDRTVKKGQSLEVSLI